MSTKRQSIKQQNIEEKKGKEINYMETSNDKLRRLNMRRPGHDKEQKTEFLLKSSTKYCHKRQELIIIK